jgi:SAM-dependent methyltransferase
MDNAPQERPRLDGRDEQDERRRIERIYRAYSSDPYYRKIWTSDAARFMLERKWEDIHCVLRSEGLDVAGLRILDLGAGGGGDCERFRRLGVRPERIVALDLLTEYSRMATQRYSWLASVVGDGAILPFRNASFEMVYQSTMLSSVLDRNLRARILCEVRRVLAPDGLFVSYDMRYPNPWNGNTHLVSAAELRSSFPDWSVRVRSTTPIPQLIRLLGFLPSSAWRALEWIPALRSHLLVSARKPQGATFT